MLKRICDNCELEIRRKPYFTLIKSATPSNEWTDAQQPTEKHYCNELCVFEGIQKSPFAQLWNTPPAAAEFHAQNKRNQE